MTPSLHPTLSAVLGKAKVGGLVLAATVLVAGSAQAATGSDLFGDDPAPVVEATDGTGDGTTDPCVTEPDDGTDPVEATEEGTAPAEELAEECAEPDEGTTDCEAPVADEGTDTTTDDGTTDPCGEPVDEGTDEDPVDEGTDEGTDEDPVDDACAAATNHGQYVSGVATSTPPGPGHGAAVREAARSDCGTKGADEPTEEETADDGHESDSDSDAAHVPPGQAKKDAGGGGAVSSPGNSGSAPGHSGGSPGNSGNAPGHNK